MENENLSEEERIQKKDDLLSHYGVQSERVHTLQQLLKAYTMFNKDEEYVIMDGEVKIVDEQTGRIMEGRRWSDGLPQCLGFLEEFIDAFISNCKSTILRVHSVPLIPCLWNWKL